MIRIEFVILARPTTLIKLSTDVAHPSADAKISSMRKFRCQGAWQTNKGASVAQWSERSPFTSEVAGSILSENFLNVTRALVTRVK